MPNFFNRFCIAFHLAPLSLSFYFFLLLFSVLFACLLAYWWCCCCCCRCCCCHSAFSSLTLRCLSFQADFCEFVHRSYIFVSSLMKSFPYQVSVCVCVIDANAPEFSMFTNGVYSSAGICFGRFYASLSMQCISMSIGSAVLPFARSRVSLCAWINRCEWAELLLLLFFVRQNFCFRRFKTTLINNYGKFFNS